MLIWFSRGVFVGSIECFSQDGDCSGENNSAGGAFTEVRLLFVIVLRTGAPWVLLAVRPCVRLWSGGYVDDYWAWGLCRRARVPDAAECFFCAMAAKLHAATLGTADWRRRPSRAAAACSCRPRGHGAHSCAGLHSMRKKRTQVLPRRHGVREHVTGGECFSSLICTQTHPPSASLFQTTSGHLKGWLLLLNIHCHLAISFEEDMEARWLLVVLRTIHSLPARTVACWKYVSACCKVPCQEKQGNIKGTSWSNPVQFVFLHYKENPPIRHLVWVVLLNHRNSECSCVTLKGALVI